MPGFPIRTPWDHSWVDSSPRPIAASHVLHRLLVPRHPPSALKNLPTQRNKDARVHYAHLNKQPTHTHRQHTHPKTGQFALKNVIGAEATSSTCSFRTQQGAK